MKIAGLTSFKQHADAVARKMADERQTESRRLRGEAYTLTVARLRPCTIAFKDGRLEEVIDPRTGEVKSREKWFWFHKSLVQIDGYRRGLWPREGETVVAHLPLRMAEERGLTMRRKT